MSTSEPTQLTTSSSRMPLFNQSTSPPRLATSAAGHGKAATLGRKPTCPLYSTSRPDNECPTPGDSNTRFTHMKVQSVNAAWEGPLPRDRGTTLPVPFEALERLLASEGWQRRIDWGLIEDDILVYDKTQNQNNVTEVGYIVVVSDRNALALEKVINYGGNKLLISNSLWAETIADNAWKFILICQSGDGKVTYEGHYTLEYEAKFSIQERRGDWGWLSINQRRSMLLLAQRTIEHCETRRNDVGYNPLFLRTYILGVIKFDMEFKRKLQNAEYLHLIPLGRVRGSGAMLKVEHDPSAGRQMRIKEPKTKECAGQPVLAADLTIFEQQENERSTSDLDSLFGD